MSTSTVDSHLDHDHDGRPRRENGARRAGSSIDRHGAVSLVLATLLVVLSAGLGAGLVAVQDPRYTAELEILHDYGDMDAAAAERRQETQESLAQGRSVLEPVAEAHGISVEELSEQLDVELVGASEVLRLRITTTDPDAAVERVAAVGESYLEVTLESDAAPTDVEETRELISERLSELDDRRAEIQDSLAELEQQRLDQAEAADEAPAPPTGEEQRLQSELQEVLRQIGDLESLRLQQDFQEAETRLEPARVLSEAYLLSDPAGPTPLRAGLIGLGIGLVLATAVVGIRSMLRTPPSGAREESGHV